MIKTISILTMIGLAYASVSDAADLSQRPANYQVIARCKELASDKAKNLKVPMLVGAVDSRGWPSYHPCKFTYFESECRNEVYMYAIRQCVIQMETYNRRGEP